MIRSALTLSLATLVYSSGIAQVLRPVIEDVAPIDLNSEPAFQRDAGLVISQVAMPEQPVSDFLIMPNCLANPAVYSLGLAEDRGAPSASQDAVAFAQPAPGNLVTHGLLS